MDGFVKKKTLDLYAENETVDDIFAISDKRSVKSYARGYCFDVVLSDAGGSVPLKYWGSDNESEVRNLHDSLKIGQVVRVSAQMSAYNNKPQISINSPENVSIVPTGSYNPSDFIRKSELDTGTMLIELQEIITTIEDPELKKLLLSYFDDADFTKKFLSCPAAMRNHHAWVGGLLEHTLAVVKISLAVIELHPPLNRDLIISGAILHDIGKVIELETSTTISYSEDGNLFGHILLGFESLSRRMTELSINEKMKKKLLHIVISHHGKKEWGSPVTPCFPEALIVHKADEMDAKTVQFLEEIAGKKQNGEKFAWSNEFERIMIE